MGKYPKNASVLVLCRIERSRSLPTLESHSVSHCNFHKSIRREQVSLHTCVVSFFLGENELQKVRSIDMEPMGQQTTLDLVNYPFRIDECDRA